MNITINPNMNFKTRRQRFGVFTLLFFMAFGISFTVVGVFALRSARIDPSWTRITGKVVGASGHISNGSTTYTPVVSYTVAGQTYQVASNAGSSAYPAVGASRTVAYNPAQPGDAKVVEGAGTAWFLYIFPVAGVGAFVLGVVLFVRSARRGKDIAKLQQEGRKVQGVVTDMQSFGRDSYRVLVSATVDGKVQNYVSDPLTGLGGLAMADFRNHPIPVDVYVSLSNPQDYYVDVSELPNLSPERITELIQQAAAHRTGPPPSQGTPPFQPL